MWIVISTRVQRTVFPFNNCPFLPHPALFWNLKVASGDNIDLKCYCAFYLNVAFGNKHVRVIHHSPSDASCTSCVTSPNQKQFYQAWCNATPPFSPRSNASYFCPANDFSHCNSIHLFMTHVQSQKDNNPKMVTDILDLNTCPHFQNNLFIRILFA